MSGVQFFKSSNVSWKQGLVRLQRATWHSCMQWGWPSINSGEHFAEWFDYWVLSLRVGSRGVCWQWYPARRGHFGRSLRLSQEADQ